MERREILISFLEENFGSLKMYTEEDLHVDECMFYNDEMELHDVLIVGNDSCWDVNEFYHYVLDGDKLYKAYFNTEDEEGEPLEIDCIDYNHAYKIEDCTKEIIYIYGE